MTKEQAEECTKCVTYMQQMKMKWWKSDLGHVDEALLDQIFMMTFNDEESNL